MYSIKTFSALTIASLLLVFSSCEKKNYADLYNEMSVSFNQGSIPADGESTALVTIDFGSPSLHKTQNVTFTTSNGMLYKSPFNPSDSGSNTITLAPFDTQAKLLLKSSTTIDDNVYVTTDINGYSTNGKIKFTTAHPNDMIISANDQNLAINEKATITVALFRNEGTSSNGIKFYMRDTIEVADTLVSPIITDYPEFTFTNNNEVTFDVGALQHSVGTRVRLFITTVNESSDTLEKSILIWYE